MLKNISALVENTGTCSSPLRDEGRSRSSGQWNPWGAAFARYQKVVRATQIQTAFCHPNSAVWARFPTTGEFMSFCSLWYRCIR